MDRIILEDFYVESVNTLNTLHWTAKGRLKKKYVEAVMVAMYSPKPPIKKAKKNQKFELHYLHIRKKRRMIYDHDNLVSGSKMLQDSLTDMKFIYDDDIKYIGKPTHKQVAGEENMIIITRQPQTP